MMLLLYFYFGNLYHSYLKCLDKRFEELTVESQATSNNIIFAPMVPWVFIKNKPQLELWLASVQLPVTVAEWYSHTLELLIWTSTPPYTPPPSQPHFWPNHTVQTRLKPLAQWCFYSYAYSKCSFSPHTISKSNSPHFPPQIKGKMYLRLHEPNPHGLITLPKFQAELKCASTTEKPEKT